AGIVHRDIKPANVMIDTAGGPVLLDFGLARDVAADGLQLTHTGEVFGTPGYMAPEQIDGTLGASGPAVDVWALGVLLYECLTGRRPFDAASREGVFSAIRSQDPSDPLGLRPGLPRGVRAVLEVALAKEPGRRYTSAAHFAEDLRRLRAGRPVLARSPGPVLRLRRAVRRHPAVATGVVAVVLGLAVALVYTDSRLRVEAGLRRTADRRADDLRRLVRHILVDLHDEIHDMPGATLANQGIVARALEFLGLLGPVDVAGMPSELRHDLALAHVKIGDVLGNPNYANLGRPVDAQTHYRTALTLAEALPDDTSRVLRAHCHHRLGNALQQAGAMAEAAAEYRAGIDLLGADDPVPVAQRARVLRLRGALHLDHARCTAHTTGRDRPTAAALAELRQAAALFDPEPDDPSARICHAAILVETAQLASELSGAPGARPAAEQAERILQALDPVARVRVSARTVAARCAGVLAELAYQGGDSDQGASMLANATESLRLLVAADPANELARRQLIESLQRVGRNSAKRGRFPAAERAFRDAMHHAEAGRVAFGAAWADQHRARCLASIGNVRYEMRDYTAALEHFSLGLAVWQAHYEQAPTDAGRRLELARAELLVARARLHLGRDPEAQLARARAHFVALRAKDPKNLDYTRPLQSISQQLGELAFGSGAYPAAVTHFREAVELCLAVEGQAAGLEGTRALAILRQGLANSTYQTKQFSAAFDIMRQSLASFRTNAERAPGDRVCRRQLALALFDTARMENRVVGAKVARSRLREAERIVDQATAARDATPKEWMAAVNVHALAAYLDLGLDRAAAGSSYDRALALRARLGTRVSPLCAQMLAVVRRGL
ncbi:MAG: serine/threonine protein kinase, partial [Planctomycetes bacterium]|nr:serine/threonine protein kinase [Planctomycetota bacterium]